MLNTNDPLFESAWSWYPDRHIAENKRDAYKQWCRRLKEGVAATEMIDGSRRYALYCERSFIKGSEFVMQPRRFFGPSRHFEQPWQINGGRLYAQAEKSNATMQKLKDHEANALQRHEAQAMLAGIRTGLHKR